MVLRWFSFRIISDDSGHQARWPPSLKIENSANKINKKSSLKRLGQLGLNFGGMVLGWSPFRIISNDPVHRPRWPPLLKIELNANIGLWHIILLEMESAVYAWWRDASCSFKHRGSNFFSPKWLLLLKIELYANMCLWHIKRIKITNAVVAWCHLIIFESWHQYFLKNDGHY